MANRQFVLIIVDSNTGEFTVEGLVTDDRPWNKAVVDAQRNGRNLSEASIAQFSAPSSLPANNPYRGRDG